jgi:hypothetical protein
MPPFSVGSAQVEERLRVVRRRLNLVTLQDALYLSGSLVTLAATLVVIVALRGRASLFAVAVWAAIGCMIAAAVAAARRIRQHWLSLEQVVRFADREAALDDRLATLLLDPRRARASALKDLLLEQILAATPRWDVDVLVPRRVPRSVFILSGALAALAMLSFFLRPPATPEPVAGLHPPSRSEAGDAAPPPHDAAEPGAHDGLAGAGAAMQVAGLAGGRNGAAQVGQGIAMGNAPAAQTGNAPGAQSGAAPAGEATGEGTTGAQQGSAGHVSSPSAAGMAAADGSLRDMSEELRKAIREALGAQPADEDMQAKSGSSPAPESRAGDRSQEAGAGGPSDAAHGADRDASGGERAASNGSDASNRQSASAVQPPAGASAHLPGSGSASNPGVLGGQSSTELFGSAPGAHMGGSEAASLGIKLSAFGGVSPDQTEPQRQSPPVGLPAVGTASRTGSQQFTDEQVPDAPLQKAEIAPQHEALVRRIFSHDE